MIGRLRSNSVLRLFSTSVVDQAMLSAANLLVALILIRFSELSEYGYFVMVQAAIALATSAQGAWLGGPISVVAPKSGASERDQMIAKVDLSRRRHLRWAVPLAGAVPIAGSALELWSEHMMWLGLAGLFATWTTLSRQYLRTALLIQQRPQTLLGVDTVYVASLFAFVGGAVLLPGQTSTWAVLGLGLSAGIAELWSIRKVGLPKTIGDAPAVRQIGSDIRRLGSWSTFGAVVYWIQSQSFNYLLAARLTVEAVAHVNAARLLLMPVFLIQTGISSLLLPAASSWLHNEGFHRLVRRLWIFESVMISLIAVYVSVLWFARDWVTTVLMAKEIADRDVLILLWAANALIAIARSIFQILLLAMRKFKQTAWLTTTSAACSLIIMWFSIERFGGPGAIIATTVGELIYMVGLIFLIRRARKAYEGEARA